MQFHQSEPLTFGVELELQIVNPRTGRLSPSCLELMRSLDASTDRQRFALEATLATIELNSAIQHSAQGLEQDLMSLTQQARDAAQQHGLDIRGGGTQLTQFWNERVMTDTPRARELSHRFGFLPKRFSTYGMHVHVGMPDADSAIRVANVLQAISPLFIALAAASPFLQLADTGFAAARPLEPLVYPHGGPMPWLRDWTDLERTAQEMYSTGIAQSLKDIYWDVRPKPEYGTVEVRVFDTPLSVRKAIGLGAFTRSMAALALNGHLCLDDSPKTKVAQRVSRFTACRDGMDAWLYDPLNAQWLSAHDWLQQLVSLLHEKSPLPDDAAHVKALVDSTKSEADHIVMRTAWTDLAPAVGDAEALTTALCAYSQLMCGRLLHS